MTSLLSLRALLVTGKGGVGKTTVAAAIARAAAARGKRVLCAEIAQEGETSSPLAEALGASGSSEEPIEIGKNIRSVLLTPIMGHHQFLRDALPIRMIADAAMKSSAIRRFLHAAPTFSELGVLYRIQDLLHAKRSDGAYEHELIVVDLPATGHALALVQVPSAVLRVVHAGPLGTAMREGLALLTDKTRVGAVIVMLPETLPVSESLELARGLSKYDVPLARMVMNRYPHDPFEPAERLIVDELVRDRDPILGARSIARIGRASAALARLKAELPAPLITIGDVWAEGTHVSQTVAEAFGAEESL